MKPYVHSWGKYSFLQKCIPCLRICINHVQTCGRCLLRENKETLLNKWWFYCKLFYCLFSLPWKINLGNNIFQIFPQNGTCPFQKSGTQEAIWLQFWNRWGVITALCKDYRQRHGNSDPYLDKNLVIYLGDNASRKCWSGVSGRIPTLRMSGGLTWSVPLNRYLTGREKMATLGWPVTPETSAAMGVHEVPVLDIRRCSMVSGNAMHWGCIGVVQLVALVCFKPVGDWDLPISAMAFHQQLPEQVSDIEKMLQTWNGDVLLWSQRS